MNKIYDSIYGFVIGDAMGVPIEFKGRVELMQNPVTKMIGYGTYNMPEGTWSDDTSMTLATMDSIANKNGIDYTDIMNSFLNWYGHSKYTATGKVFDIGRTTYCALLKYASKETIATSSDLNNITDNGNGSLMRMLPIALYSYYNKFNDDEIYEIVKNTSSLTHAHEISILGCFIYVKYIHNLLNGKDKYASLNMVKCLDFSMFSDSTLKKYERILNETLEHISLDKIKSTGYIVDTLESVLWVILNTTSFTEAIIGSINLGDDTDTIGAITGSIAGILYGYENIPSKWIDKLKNKELIDNITKGFSRVLER